MPLAFLAVFFVYPVVAIVGRGLAPDGTLDLDPLGEVVTDAVAAPHRLVHGVAGDRCRRCSRVLIALPGAYVLARYEFRGRRVVRALVTVPFVLPTVVVGSAFASAARRRADRSRASASTRPSWAILIAHVFFNYAVVVRTVGGLWSHLDPRQEEAARMLGASRWRAFREVTLPALRPAIAAAAAVVFLFTFTSFGVILILGGPRFATLETEIYRQTAQLLNLPARRRAHHRAARRGRRAARRDRLDRGPRAASPLRLRAVARDRAPAAHRLGARVCSPPTSR